MNYYWDSLVQRLQFDSRQGMKIFTIICDCYGAPGRYYHNLNHIRFCLQQLDLTRNNLENRDAMELAIWFHDLIYVPGCRYNEEISAATAAFVLQQAGCSGQLSNNVYDLILSTKHFAVEQIGRQPVDYIVADIDLSILGANEQVFYDYEEKIRQEYAFLAEQLYRKERCNLLQKLLQRPYIYFTELFRDLYEHNARRNIYNLINYFTT